MLPLYIPVSQRNDMKGGSKIRLPRSEAFPGRTAGPNGPAARWGVRAGAAGRSGQGLVAQGARSWHLADDIWSGPTAGERSIRNHRSGRVSRIGDPHRHHRQRTAANATAGNATTEPAVPRRARHGGGPRATGGLLADAPGGELGDGSGLGVGLGAAVGSGAAPGGAAPKFSSSPPSITRTAARCAHTSGGVTCWWNVHPPSVRPLRFATLPPAITAKRDGAQRRAARLLALRPALAPTLARGLARSRHRRATCRSCPRYVPAATRLPSAARVSALSW